MDGITWAQAVSKKLAGVSRSSERLELLAHVLDLLPVGVTLADATNPSYPLVYVNDRFCEMTGFSREEVLGENCRFLQIRDWHQTAAATLRALIQHQQAGDVVMRNHRKDGTLFHNHLTLTPITDESGVLEFYLGVQVDVTSEVEAERKRAPVDMLTGLPDRSALLTDIDALVAAAKAGGKMTSFEVMVLDLDDFHLVNSEFGFAAGDACLKLVAERMGAVAPEGAMVGRLGGVQFLCVYQAPDQLSKVDDLGVALMAAVENPQDSPDPFNLRLSVGTATFPKDGATAEVLVQKAKVAMHYARSEKIRYPLPYVAMLT